ncbi:hypothetical protein SBA5_140057 [Candidatus Sulfotelmatomonas gaucii]|uniref:Uncharacterized protein n=1 Tax=Candidatus Sulfuritelmatomonas gaucii TaxID=2043161 RepID=A0A2N9L4M2_9BACT|nr:hypothetical protein SBA5_140057 [Candidatus Sulfotelmatomonas gaucii]
MCAGGDTSSLAGDVLGIESRRGFAEASDESHWNRWSLELGWITFVSRSCAS